jgi:hypothetical protein
MPLNALDADLLGIAENVDDDAAPLDARGRKFDLIVRVLQRDDPLRRSYLQRRRHSQAAGRCNERAASSAIALSRR